MSVYLRPSSPHYRYAVQVLISGLQLWQVERDLGIKPRTARHWRRKLCSDVEAELSVPVPYPIAVLYALAKSDGERQAIRDSLMRTATSDL